MLNLSASSVRGSPLCPAHQRPGAAVPLHLPLGGPDARLCGRTKAQPFCLAFVLLCMRFASVATAFSQFASPTKHDVTKQAARKRAPLDSSIFLMFSPPSELNGKESIRFADLCHCALPMSRPIFPCGTSKDSSTSSMPLHSKNQPEPRPRPRPSCETTRCALLAS